jgi:hypothetical protein
MGFDKPAIPNVEDLAAVQAGIAFCHRRVHHSALRDPHFVLRDLKQAHRNDEPQIE